MTEDPTLSGPIESLQLMLRTLSMLDEELPTLVPLPLQYWRNTTIPAP